MELYIIAHVSSCTFATCCDDDPHMLWTHASPYPQDSAPTLEALAADEEAADAQDAQDTSCGVLEEGQAEEAFLADARSRGAGTGENKTSSVDL